MQGLSPNIASNVKRIRPNSLTSVPLKLSANLCFFDDFKEYRNLLICLILRKGVLSGQRQFLATESP